MAEIIVTEKRCTKCGVLKPLSEFHRFRRSPDGYKPTCCVCNSISACEWQRKNKEKHRRSRLRYSRSEKRKTTRHILYANSSDMRERRRVENLRKFGLTVHDYEKMFKEQLGVCAICEQPSGSKRLAVDHDHQTGRIRGLLCAGCNVILGRWKDSPEIAMRAHDYLKRYAQLRLVG